MAKSLRLTIRNHHDACMIMNALREHGEKMQAGYQCAALKALRDGNRAEADKFFSWRDAAYQCQHRTTERLDKIRIKFEQMMPDPDDYPDHDDSGGGGYGYSTDNATCYN